MARCCTKVQTFLETHYKPLNNTNSHNLDFCRLIFCCTTWNSGKKLYWDRSKHIIMDLSFFKCLNSGTCAFYDSSSRSPSFSVRRRRPIRPKLSKRRMQLKSPRKEMDTKAQQFHSVKIWSFFSYLEFLRETDFRFWKKLEKMPIWQF